MDKKYKHILFLDNDTPSSYNDDLVDTSFKSVLDAFSKNKGIRINGNIPSLKNSKQIGKKWMTTCCNSKYDKLGKIYICHKCHKASKLKSVPSIISSDLVKAFKDSNKSQFLENQRVWYNIIEKKEFPYIFGFYFIRDSNRAFDYDNAKQLILDMMRDNKYIPDDSADYVKTVDLGYHKDANEPGVYIIVIDKLFISFDKENFNM